MIRKVSVAFAALFAFAGTAQAQTVTSQRPASVVAALQAEGFKAELTKDDGGDPMIKSTSSGTDFLVLFYGCTKNVNCTSIQFYAGYADGKVSLSKLNDWNSSHRFSRAYISDKGAARVESDLDLDVGGMSTALFADNFEVWTTTMAAFEKHIAD